jgi:hypothetical protein
MPKGRACSVLTTTALSSGVRIQPTDHQLGGIERFPFAIDQLPPHVASKTRQILLLKRHFFLKYIPRGGGQFLGNRPMEDPLVRAQGCLDLSRQMQRVAHLEPDEDRREQLIDLAEQYSRLA